MDNQDNDAVKCIMDLWGLEEAIERITHRGSLDLISIMNDPNWVIMATSTHTFSSRVGALERAKGLARLSVSLGEIQDSDTPANWIRWAKQKGYDTSHLQKYIDFRSLLQKMPSTEIGRVVITVACEIEQESGSVPTAKDVMAKLKDYAQSGEKHSDVLRQGPNGYRGNGVYWITGKFEEKEFSLEACQKTLMRYLPKTPIGGE